MNVRVGGLFFCVAFFFTSISNTCFQLGNDWSFWNFHAQMKPEFVKLFPYFDESGFTKVSNFHQLVFGEAYQIADCLLYTSPSPRD